MKVAFIYEHPAWSESLIKELQSRPIELQLFNVSELAFDSDIEGYKDFDLAINRVNIMPSSERMPQVVFQTSHFLGLLEMSGIRLINGPRSHFIGSSKAMQNGIFSSLDLPCPRARAIYRMEDALSAADDIGFPVIIKPNIGGSGSGIGKYDNREELERAVRLKALDLGVDRTGLVQQYIHSDGYVYRVEILGKELFYSIRQKIQEDNFNYCAADGCSTEMESQSEDETFDFCVVEGERRIEPFAPEPDIVNNIVKIVAACSADVGGVEYFIDAESGAPCFYDFNPYSNFVANGETLLGFSPEKRYVDFVLGQVKA